MKKEKIIYLIYINIFKSTNFRSTKLLQLSTFNLRLVKLWAFVIYPSQIYNFDKGAS